MTVHTAAATSAPDRLAAGGIEYGSGRRETDGGTDRLLFDARLEAREVVQLVPAP
jgi:hypothetical protein